MNTEIPKYRVCTTVPVQKNTVLENFKDCLSFSPSIHLDTLNCDDGSVIVFQVSSIPNLYYFELQCLFHEGPEGSVNFGLLPRMLQFCKEVGCEMKVVRNNTVLPATGGIFSDVFHSKAYKAITHKVNHPKSDH